METTNNALTTLKQELEFLDRGGYRRLIGSRQPLFCMETGPNWRKPSIFEDSPACPKKTHCPCSEQPNCMLASFVPMEHQHEAVPCRYVPLNATGETVDSLQRNSREERIESEVRGWLVNTIQTFNPSTAAL